MSNDAKSVGTKFETDVVGYLRGRGISGGRIARSVPDQGDVLIGEGDFVAQLKARRDGKSPLSLGAWLKAAGNQAKAYAESNGLRSSPVPVLVVKNPRHSIGDSFVIMHLKDFISDEQAGDKVPDRADS